MSENEHHGNTEQVDDRDDIHFPIQYKLIFNSQNEISKSVMSMIGSAQNVDINYVEEILLNELQLIDKLHVKQPSSGTCGLYIACLLNNFELVKLFVEHGANVNARTRCYQTPLHLLLYGPQIDIEIVHYLINHGANLTLADRYYRTPLLVAVEEKHVSAVRSILPHTSDINEVICTKCTPLMHTAWKGSVEIVDLLLANGADPNFILNGIMAIHYSIFQDNSKIFKHLLDISDYDCIIKCESSKSLAETIICYFSIECLKVLLESDYCEEFLLKRTYRICGSYPFCSRYKKESGLGYVFRMMKTRPVYEKMFDLMITSGFPVNCLSKRCIPPLTVASNLIESEDIINKLIQNGADVNYPDARAPEALLSSLTRIKPNILLLLFQHCNFATPDTVLSHYTQEYMRPASTINPDAIRLFLRLGMSQSSVNLLSGYHSKREPDYRIPVGSISTLQQLCRIAVRNRFYSEWNGLSINEILKKFNLPVSTCEYLRYEIV